jgi:hypothetical protein
MPAACSWNSSNPRQTRTRPPVDTPILLIAALVIAALLIFAIIRKITKLIVITILLGVIVIALYIARAEGYITW